MVALGLAAAFLLLWLRHAMTDSVDAGLRVRADEATSYLEATDLSDVSGAERQFSTSEDGSLQVVAEHGKPLLRRGLSGAALREAVRGVPPGSERIRRTREVTYRGDEVRTLAVGAETRDGRPVTAVVSSSLEARGDALESLQLALLLGVPLLSLFVIGAAVHQLRLPLDAVRRIGAETSLITSTDSDVRVHARSRVIEVDALANTMNGMLDRLRQASERQRNFVAVASHEFRTPLATLKASAESLELQLAEALGPPARTTLAGIHSELDRLVQIADSLLLLAEQERSQIAVAPHPVELGNLLDGVVQRFAGRAELLERVIVHQVPPDQARSLVRVDRVLIEQALANLIDNALRHGEGRVTINGRIEQHELRLWVEDDGAGIDDADSIFEPFASAGSRSHGTHRGAGLGLSIVRAIAHAHGGTCELEVLPGGRVVVLHLPIAESGDPERSHE